VLIIPTVPLSRFFTVSKQQPYHTREAENNSYTTQAAWKHHPCHLILSKEQKRFPGL